MNNYDRIKKELAQYIIDRVDDYTTGNVDMNDLHNELFNTDYYIIGTYEAKKWLEKYDTFDCIEIVKDYEQENFGEVNTDFTDAEKIVNMVAYILGEEVLYSTDMDFDGILTQEKADRLKLKLTLQYL